MKKTLLALAVPAALVAGSASAGVNLYNSDGVTVDLSGAAEVQYYKDGLKDDEDKIRLDDGDLALDVVVDVNDSLAVVSGIAYKFESEGDDSTEVLNDELWVGFSGDFGTLTAGRLYLIADDAGNTKDYEFGGDTLGFARGQTGQGLKYVYDNGQFYAGLSASLKEDGKEGPDEETVIDGRVGARFGDADVRLYFFDASDLDGIAGLDQTGFNLELDYVWGDYSFAASYGQTEDKAAGSLDLDTDVFAVSADYTMNNTTFAGGYTLAQVSVGSADADAQAFYVNVTQQLHSNAKVYGEVAYYDVDNIDTDLAYVVGLEVKF
ncbi:porin [Thaumasiovibrio sp. DFM-14]|uniref:porin n=1 Tax=Thaumasiovibrio sp. DFM-14 TaxID=3384792 RepID=UPI0039A15137